jgi:hypothetical protein
VRVAIEKRVARVEHHGRGKAGTDFNHAARLRVAEHGEKHHRVEVGVVLVVEVKAAALRVVIVERDAGVGVSEIVEKRELCVFA